jgi:hypothetical protein
MGETHTSFPVQEYSFRREFHTEQTPSMEKPEDLTELNPPGYGFPLRRPPYPFGQLDPWQFRVDKVPAFAVLKILPRNEHSRMGHLSRTLEQDPEQVRVFTPPFTQQYPPVCFTVPMCRVAILSAAGLGCFNHIQVGKRSPDSKGSKGWVRSITEECRTARNTITLYGRILLSTFRADNHQVANRRRNTRQWFGTHASLRPWAWLRLWLGE